MRKRFFAADGRRLARTYADHDGLLSVYRQVRRCPSGHPKRLTGLYPRSNSGSEFRRHPISESRINGSPGRNPLWHSTVGWSLERYRLGGQEDR